MPSYLGTSHPSSYTRRGDRVLLWGLALMTGRQPSTMNAQVYSDWKRGSKIYSTTALLSGGGGTREDEYWPPVIRKISRYLLGSGTCRWTWSLAIIPRWGPARSCRRWMSAIIVQYGFILLRECIIKCCSWRHMLAI
ncbi:hypothetical protein L873DRAFT_1804283 [Choiromyces venosus 120613-1]|uniref:Uncharacterized protein n=1 Tax=Choiromyces venosus 120613-1 TaxID=1336337 RepID=A0A3N4JS00_9PEZI|nr:hypothetical protein L873DRAFT_1804283 [Choiromyces venosus 120613-1]